MEIILTIIVVSIGWFIYHKSSTQNIAKQNENFKHDLNNQTINRDYHINHKVSEKVEELNNQILELKKQLLDVERESYDKGKKHAEETFKSDYVVQVNPFKRVFKEKKDGIIAFGSTEKIEVGYQYQLFVKGVPALNPAMIVVETYELKSFNLNDDAIKSMINSAVGDKSEIVGGIIRIASNVIEKK